MTGEAPSSVHGSVVKVGCHGVLIRGPSGAGKARLAFELIRAGRSGELPPAILVADDRVRLDTDGKELWARAIPELAGLIEIRGLGIRGLPFEPVAVAGLVVDLAAADAQRLPDPDATRAEIAGVALARLAIAASASPLPLVIAALRLAESAVCGGFAAPVVAPQQHS